MFAQVLFLSFISQNIIYLQRAENAGRSFICINQDMNDTFPSESCYQMEIADNSTFYFDVNQLQLNATDKYKYKFMVTFPDGRRKNSPDWLPLIIPKAPVEYSSSENDNSNISNVDYPKCYTCPDLYTNFCVSVIIILASNIIFHIITILGTVFMSKHY